AGVPGAQSDRLMPRRLIPQRGPGTLYDHRRARLPSRAARRLAWGERLAGALDWRSEPWGGAARIGAQAARPLSSGCGPSLSAASRQRQSAGVSGARPWAARARSHWGLAWPYSHEASTSRQTLGRWGWMVQREYTPMSASSATQRTGSE